MEALFVIIAGLLAGILFFIYKLFDFVCKKEKEKEIRTENYLYKIWAELHKISYLSETPEYKKMNKDDKENIIMKWKIERGKFKEDVDKYVEKEIRWN